MISISAYAVKHREKSEKRKKQKEEKAAVVNKTVQIVRQQGHRLIYLQFSSYHRRVLN